MKLDSKIIVQIVKDYPELILDFGEVPEWWENMAKDNYGVVEENA